MASGISLLETLREPGHIPWLLSVNPEKGKVERAQQQSLKFEQRQIWLPVKADWLPAYEAELFQFPHSKFDDQVGSTVQLLAASDYSNFHQQLKIL